MIKIQAILGSTREGRSGDKVARWFLANLPKNKEVEIEFIDLKDWNLPLLSEAMPPVTGQPGSVLTEKWRSKISLADGYIFITPEYNHGYSAVLKNAIDHAFYQWQRKPVAFVSYGGLGAGIRAVEQLIQVSVELNMVPLRTQVNIPMIWTNFDEKGNFKTSTHNDEKAVKVYEDLFWMTKALKIAREQKVEERIIAS